MTITRTEIEEIVEKHADVNWSNKNKAFVDELMALLEPEKVERPVPPWVVKAERADVLATPKENPIEIRGRGGATPELEGKNPIAGWEGEFDEMWNDPMFGGVVNLEVKDFITRVAQEERQKGKDEAARIEEHPLFSVGYRKGEMNFGVNGGVCDLSYEGMKELREMIVVGIGQVESMWARSKEKDYSVARTNPPTHE